MAKLDDPTFDPRPWNLTARGAFRGAFGATLALGCGPQPIANDGGTTTDPSGGTDESEAEVSSFTTVTTVTSDDDPPECENNSDCEPGYECVGGVCEYYGYQDGNIWYECYDDSDCPAYALCDGVGGGGYCNYVDQPPPPCQFPAPIPRTLEPGAPPLGLAFTDVDADGRDELVVATQDAFLIYTPDSDVPSASPRIVPSPHGELIGGDFDLDPGEDVVVNEVDGGLVLYSSDGVGGFPTRTPIPLSELMVTNAMAAGDADGQAPDELLVTADTGAYLLSGLAMPLLLSDLATSEPMFLDLGHTITGLAVVNLFGDIERFDLLGAPLNPINGVDPEAAVALGRGDEALYVSARTITNWTLVRSFDAETGLPYGEGVLPQANVDLSPVDLDGDGFDQTLVRHGSNDAALWLQGCLLDLETGAVMASHIGEVAVGDHDGDGGEEFAMRFTDDTIMLFDFEPP